MDRDKRAGRQARLLRDSQPVRLGNIASNLARVGSHRDDPRFIGAVKMFVEESKWFCEWAGIEAARSNDIETAHTLLTLQRQLARWDHHFDEIYADPVRRAEMAETARAWSNHLLVLSGLLTPSARDTRAHDPA
jgi:hypothetical protein